MGLDVQGNGYKMISTGAFGTTIQRYNILLLGPVPALGFSHSFGFMDRAFPFPS